MLFLFFFFQAEDGIRDWSVTGVQTCALPIYGPDRVREERRDELERLDQLARGHQRILPLPHHRRAGVILPALRSEERRVGKECRSRWSPYHSKKQVVQCTVTVLSDVQEF